MNLDQIGLNNTLQNLVSSKSKSQKASQFDELKNYIVGIINKGGPELQDYVHMDNWMSQVALGHGETVLKS